MDNTDKKDGTLPDSMKNHSDHSSIADMNYNDIQYVLPMELQSGENTIEVTIKNASGVTEESGIIKYQK